MFIATKHAYSMLKKRLGLGKKAGLRMAVKAIFDGMDTQDTTGNLNFYLMCRVNDSGYESSEVKLYNTSAFIFVGVCLVTVYDLPKWLWKEARRQEKEWRERAEVKKSA